MSFILKYMYGVLLQTIISRQQIYLLIINSGSIALPMRYTIKQVVQFTL